MHSLISAYHMAYHTPLFRDFGCPRPASPNRRSWRIQQRWHCQQPPVSCSSSVIDKQTLTAVAPSEPSEHNGSTSQARLIAFENGTYTVEGAVRTVASPDEVWAVLTDYEGLAEVFSNIKRSTVLSREPEIVLHQDCKWEFLVFSGNFGAELSVREDRQRANLTFSLIKSSFMNSFVGQWQIRPQQDGGSLVEHRLTVEPMVSPPAFMTGYTQKIFVKQVASILRDLEERMERGSEDPDDWGA